MKDSISEIRFRKNIPTWEKSQFKKKNGQFKIPGGPKKVLILFIILFHCNKGQILTHFLVHPVHIKIDFGIFFCIPVIPRKKYFFSGIFFIDF
jgi:hypothetical protein